jgi:hypothetical protein
MSVIVIAPIVYLAILNTVVPEGNVAFLAGWEDNSFLSEYSGVGWSDSNFSQGWTMNWTNVNSGFAVDGSVADLNAIFNGYNPTHDLGISGIFIQKQIDHLDTSNYPYLVIRNKESSSDSSLALSFALVDDKGIVHQGHAAHTSTSWTNLEANLSEVYSGIVNGILMLFMNSFNPNYSGGLQHAYVQAIDFYQNSPAWRLAYSNPLNSSIFSNNGLLEVFGNGHIKGGYIVSAQRTSDLEFDLNKYRYLNVSVMTSGLDVAARVVIWTQSNLDHAYAVLLKTYNDKDWHTEIIDLSYYFDVSASRLFMIELGWIQVQEGHSSTVSYRQLSFNSVEVS